MGELYNMLKARKIVGSSGGSATLITKSITQNGTYSASDDSADGYSEVSVDVANSYTAQDEGKVVSSGQLVAQTSTTYTANDVYDTTLINSVTVNVPTGTKIGTLTPSASSAQSISVIDAHYAFINNILWFFGKITGVSYSSTIVTLDMDIPLTEIGVPDSKNVSSSIYFVSPQTNSLLSNGNTINSETTSITVTISKTSPDTLNHIYGLFNFS